MKGNTFLRLIFMAAICLVFVMKTNAELVSKRDKNNVDSLATTIADSVTAKAPPKDFFGKILHAVSPKEYKNWIDKQAMKKRIRNARSVSVDSKGAPMSIRAIHKKKHDSFGYKTERQWDSIQNIKFLPVDDTLNDLSKIVYGFHPYWKGRSYLSYNFSLLSRVAYFSYSLHPATGSYESIHSWKTTKLREEAHRHGCKVDLSVTNFGVSNNRKFLKNVKAQNTLIDTLIMLISEYGGDGVNIDFEGVSITNKKDFTNFIINLSTKFKAVNPEYKLSLSLPAIDFNNVFDIAVLQKYVDYFIIMGYDFYGKSSTVAGPNAPIFSGTVWYPFNIEKTLTEYLQDKSMNPAQCILAVPYYGKEWVTTKGTIPSKTKKFVESRTYRFVQDNYKDNYEVSFDTVSCSSYYTFHNGANWVQCWFDNIHSLSVKYDLILKNNIAGVGIWALGYDNGYTELWRLLKQKFATSSVKKTPNTAYLDTLSQKHGLAPVAKPEVKKKGVIVQVRRFVNIIALSIFVFLFFGIIGFIYTITDCNVRDLVFKSETAVYLFVLVILVMLVIFMRIFDVLQDKEITFFLGVFLGMVITYIILRKLRKRKYSKDTP
ncbi:MAG: hypothetical protein C0594_09260 [Marinilabiliales bacterium]|nr:MAG: hypothetical protein C0594_09260 [Marinilabiliales bacterium]